MMKKREVNSMQMKIVKAFNQTFLDIILRNLYEASDTDFYRLIYKELENQLYLIEYYFNKSHHPVQNSTSAFLELSKYEQMLSTDELLKIKSTSGINISDDEFG
jgi:hypothetical protein